MFRILKLAGVVAVEVTGGPEIPFHPGRPVSVQTVHLHILSNILTYLCFVFNYVIELIVTKFGRWLIIKLGGQYI